MTKHNKTLIKNQYSNKQNIALDKELFDGCEFILDQKFKDNPVETVNKFTYCEKKIFNILLRYRNAPFIYIKNKTIADEVGCTTKTVWRALTKFVKLGIIQKRQRNQFAPNNIKLNPKINGKISFSLYINVFNKKAREVLFSIGLLVAPVVNKTFTSVNVYQKCISSSQIVKEEYKKETSPTPSYNFKVPKNKWIKVQKLRHIKTLVRKLEKEKEKVPPKEKERIALLLTNPKISEKLFDNLDNEIAAYLELPLEEKLELIAIPKEAKHYAYKELIRQNKKSLLHFGRSRLSWFMAVCSRYSKANNLKFNRWWYISVCNVLKIKPWSKEKTNAPAGTQPRALPKPINPPSADVSNSSMSDNGYFVNSICNYKSNMSKNITQIEYDDQVSKFYSMINSLYLSVSVENKDLLHETNPEFYLKISQLKNYWLGSCKYLEEEPKLILKMKIIKQANTLIKELIEPHLQNEIKMKVTQYIFVDHDE